jgi:hypothetical protein
MKTTEKQARHDHEQAMNQRRLAFARQRAELLNAGMSLGIHPTKAVEHLAWKSFCAGCDYRPDFSITKTS